MALVEVILPLAINKLLTYRVPPQMEDKIGIGYRVIVPLGTRNKFYTGIIYSFVEKKSPEGFDIKDIAAVLDDFPIVVYPQLKLWQWIADYYLCSLGEVMKAALPSALKIESETYVEPGSDIDDSLPLLSERGLIIVNYLRKKEKASIFEIEKDTGLRNLGKEISGLLDKGIVVVSERLQEKYHPKKTLYIRLLSDVSAESINCLFAATKGAQSQTRILQFLIAYTQKRKNRGEDASIGRKELLEECGNSVSALDGLLKKGIVEQFKKEINRFKYNGEPVQNLSTLSEAQHEAFNGILERFKDFNTSLFHGVTSSGKTEVYQYLLKQILNLNCQALFLVPEIALTTQLTKRMQRVFGDKVIIYHSKFSDNERVELWLRLLKRKDPCIVIGTRSSVFLPFSNLKLVIVDEEHESSYKQVEPAPRYNARDVAIVLAGMHGAKVLLGSATPSVESFWKAKNGKFGLVQLKQRYNNLPLPEIEIIDMTDASAKRQRAGSFALKSLRYLQEKVEEGHQAIVFQNRRGFAPLARCRMCAYTPKCTRCDVALTYHKNIDSLVCHYCGNIYPMPKICPQCGEASMDVVGVGTERLEEEISLRLPNARLARLDLDTTRNKDSYARIIDDFSARKHDILIGTQMVTKGLDFGNVSVVVVTNADALINFPDFRATERAFNMLEQVSGRAGRSVTNSDKVFIQSFDPSHYIFRYLQEHDYEGFYDSEITLREKYRYPPFGRIINIYLKHRDKEELNRIASHYASILRQSLGERVLGPEEPLVSKIQNYYIKRIMLKVETGTSQTRLKDYLREVHQYLVENGQAKNTIIYFDVDPA